MKKTKESNNNEIETINKEEQVSGIYRFDWGIEGMGTKASTFFPHTWSSKKVQRKILEAYEYARKHKISPILQKKTNNLLVSGFTEEGIEVIMVIDQQDNLIVAYPGW